MKRSLINCGDYTLVPLADGQVAIIDTDVAEIVGQHNWRDNGRGYAKTHTPTCWFGKPKGMFLHHLVVGHPIGGLMTDHINGETFDNRRVNLQIITNQHNQHKQKPQLRTTSSVYKGVSWNKGTGKWEARIKINGKSKYLGLYELEIQAAKAYDDSAIKLFGEFAKTNF